MAKGEDRPTVERAPERVAASMTTTELVKEITSQVGLLAKKQVELAKSELRADIRSEAMTAGGVGIGAITALIALTMMLVSLVLAMSLRMPGWMAGLFVSGILLGLAAIIALIGWRKRVSTPMARTRSSLKEDVQWAKGRLA